MIKPKKMCRNHLLGEHKEIHQLVGIIIKKRMNVLLGHAKLKQIQTRSIIERHDELVEEMIFRGYSHKSPLKYFEPIDIGEVDLEANLIDLAARCPSCHSRISGEHDKFQSIVRDLF